MIIGIDHGPRHTGVAELHGDGLRRTYSRRFRLPADGEAWAGPAFDRFAAMLTRMLADGPKCIVIEYPPRAGRDYWTDGWMAACHIYVLALAARYPWLEVGDPAPGTWRKQVVGTGAATDAQTLMIVRSLGWKPASEHEADAAGLVEWRVAQDLQLFRCTA